MKRKENLLNEFMLEDVREVRANFGKYHVYQPDTNFYDIIIKLIQDNQDKVDGDGNFEVYIGSEDQLLIDLLRASTDLPDYVLEPDNFKMIKNKPRKFFRDVLTEIEMMVNEVIGDTISKTMSEIATQERIMKNMNPKQREIYQKAVADKLKKLEQTQIDKQPELTVVKNEDKEDFSEDDIELAKKLIKLMKKSE